MLTQLLQYYDFTEREAKVYLAGLSLGSAPGSTIARHAGEKRVTVYAILKELLKRGIFTSIVRDDVTYFAPISPEQLVRNYEDKCQRLKEKLPELMAMTEKMGNKPKVEFYEGLGGLKQVFDVVLSAGPNQVWPFLTFVGTDDMDPKVKKYLHEEFIPKRLKVSIPTRAIMPKEETEYLKYHEDQHNVVVLDKPLFNLANEISLFNGNQVAIFMYGTEELSGMIITSKSLHDTLKNLFELVRNIYYPTK